ncbi:hypothetical protein PMIN07_008477 [Paraphaeosphaeria minitans]
MPHVYTSSFCIYVRFPTDHGVSKRQWYVDNIKTTAFHTGCHFKQAPPSFFCVRRHTIVHAFGRSVGLRTLAAKRSDQPPPSPAIASVGICSLGPRGTSRPIPQAPTCQTFAFRCTERRKLDVCD